MEITATKSKKNFLAILAFTGWFALVLQYCLMMDKRVVSIAETSVRFFSFFTILTNILVALYCSFVSLKPQSRWGRFFSQPTVTTAVTVYIMVVGIVYNVILRFIWNPQGWDKVADELLHLVIPILFVLHWILFKPKGTLNWKETFPWLIYPLVYFIWVLIFGALTDFYPYPFVNVSKLGYSATFLNSMVVTLVFFVLSLLLVAIDRFMKPKNA